MATSTLTLTLALTLTLTLTLPLSLSLSLSLTLLGGDINFTVSAVSGCSSMAQIHPQSRYKNILRTWGLKCDEAFEKRIQP